MADGGVATEATEVKSAEQTTPQKRPVKIVNPQAEPLRNMAKARAAEVAKEEAAARDREEAEVLRDELEFHASEPKERLDGSPTQRVLKQSMGHGRFVVARPGEASIDIRKRELASSQGREEDDQKQEAVREDTEGKQAA